LEILHKIWSLDSQENHEICFHQMSAFKAKMHQNQLPRPHWGSLQRSPDTLVGFNGA